jgi:hypothetical protein
MPAGRDARCRILLAVAVAVELKPSASTTSLSTFQMAAILLCRPS